MSATATAGLRIGEVAKRVGTTPRTIRYYEEIGLLPAEGARESGRHRLYGERDVARLREALRLKELLGVSLDELKELLEAEASSRPNAGSRGGGCASWATSRAHRRLRPHAGTVACRPSAVQTTRPWRRPVKRP